MATRSENEKTFEHWTDHEDGSRIYWYELSGKHGWKARYVKYVDKNELTTRFTQEIYNEEGELVEVHEKYPVDKGHQSVRR
jgi:hypothetical protein